MRKLDWKERAELAGIFAILASLIFVAIQLRQQEELLEVEIRSSMLANSAMVTEFIIENPGIWIRGNAGEDLTASEYEVYRRIFTNFNDYYFQTAQMFEVLDGASEDQALAMFAGFLARNPGAYRVWIDRERQINADRTAVDPMERITTDWIEAIESRIEIIRSSSAKKSP